MKFTGPPDAPPRPPLTPEQQAELEASNAAAEAYVRSLVTEVVSAAGVDALNAIVRKSASVGDLNTWKEPNDQAHRNYCGPATIQVTIDAQIPKSMVPNIEAIKDRINLLTPGGFDPASGTTDVAMCKYLWDHYVNVIRFWRALPCAAAGERIAADLVEINWCGMWARTTRCPPAQCQVASRIGVAIPDISWRSSAMTPALKTASIQSRCIR
jgi:hypothetical protein